MWNRERMTDADMAAHETAADWSGRGRLTIFVARYYINNGTTCIDRIKCRTKNQCTVALAVRRIMGRARTQQRPRPQCNHFARRRDRLVGGDCQFVSGASAMNGNDYYYRIAIESRLEFFCAIERNERIYRLRLVFLPSAREGEREREKNVNLSLQSFHCFHPIDSFDCSPQIFSCFRWHL